MSKKFLVINGPNLNMLGQRDKEQYGSQSLAEIEQNTVEKFKKYNFKWEWFQSNIEGELVERIQHCTSEEWNAIIINPAAYSHTSVAISDALELVKIPIIEVHLSNTHAREDYRKTRLTAEKATTIIEGSKSEVYILAALSQSIELIL